MIRTFGSLWAVSRRIRACPSGTVAVEAAFILPLLLLALLGTLEIGRLAWTQSALNFAVQEAARCAALQKDICGSPIATAKFAAAKVKAVNVPAAAFSLTAETCGQRVRAHFEHRLILYPIFQANPTLTANFCRA